MDWKYFIIRSPKSTVFDSQSLLYLYSYIIIIICYFVRIYVYIVLLFDYVSRLSSFVVLSVEKSRSTTLHLSSRVNISKSSNNYIYIYVNSIHKSFYTK